MTDPFTDGATKALGLGDHGGERLVRGWDGTMTGMCDAISPPH